MKYYLNNKTINKTIYPLFPETLGDALVLWLDADDTDTVTLNGSSISKWDDKSGNGYNATQSIADDQPTYPAEQDRVIFNASDRLLTTLPATTGTLVLGTTNGTAAYGVNIPAGSYDIGRRGGDYMPDDTAYGYIITNTVMSQTDIDSAIAYLRGKGAGQNYGSITNFANYWRGWSELTSFPLIDTSSATAFESAWDSCSNLTSFPVIDTSAAVSLQTAWRMCSSLVSFPLINTGSVTNFLAAWIGCSSLVSFPSIDTSSGTNFFAAWQSCSSLASFPLLNTTSATNFQQAWQFCNNLTSFPANFFDNCLATNFTNAFRNTNLSQQSIDNILVSIESNGTSNGTFNQSGGSAPSATGEAAIDALVARGWTVTVTGGYQPSAAWSPSDLSSTLALWLDADDADSVTLNGSSVSQWRDKSGNAYHAIQNVADDQPTYPAEQDRVIFNASDRLLTTLPATTGTLVLGTTNGTAAYGVNIPAGSYDIGRRGGNYMPGGVAYGYILSNTAMSQAYIDSAIAYLRDKGAGQDYGSVTNFTSFWRDWSELTSFPLIDSSAGTDFYAAWFNCTSLTSFPLIDTSAGTDFSAAWFNCTGLTSFPLIDTSAGTDFWVAWYACSSLTSFPLIDTSAGTNFRSAWANCTGLTSFPLINTSAGTNFYAAWYACSSLTSFPLINTSAGTNFYAAWFNCTSLTSFPLINTSAGTNFQSAWQNCNSLTSFPANFFDNCLATNFTNAFRNTNLSQQSIDNILVSIESNGTSNGTFNQSGGSAPSATGEAAITALRNRGWIVTVTGGF